MTSAAARAAEMLRAKADRIEARGEEDKQRQANALRRVADVVREGLDSVRPGRSSIADSDLKGAAEDIGAFAQRRAEEGTQRMLGGPVPAGWSVGGSGLPIHRATLLEANDIYQLANALHYDSYREYLRGLLLESVSDFAGAADVLEAVEGHYAKFGREQAERCRKKAAGKYDTRKETASIFGRLASMFKGKGIDATPVRQAQDAILSAMDSVASQAADAESAEEDSAPLANRRIDRATDAAQVFAEHLAAGAFASAQAMLAANLRKTSADDLRNAYEEMTGCDEASADESQVQVMSSYDNMPDMVPADLGWVYVAIFGEEFNEAVTVIVTEESGQARIRGLEWGRP